MTAYRNISTSTPDLRATLEGRDYPTSTGQKTPHGATRRASDAASHVRNAAWNRLDPASREVDIPTSTHLFNDEDATAKVVARRLSASIAQGVPAPPVKPPLQQLYDQYAALPSDTSPPRPSVLLPLMRGSDAGMLARMPAAWLQTASVAKTWLKHIDADGLRNRIADCCPHILRHPKVLDCGNGYTRKIFGLIESKLGSRDAILDIAPDRFTQYGLRAILFTLGDRAKEYVARHHVQIRRLKLSREEKSDLAVLLRNHASCPAAHKILRAWPLPSDPWPMRARKTIINLFQRVFSRHA
ncbi:hypothetical protein [Bordetella sp. LUAb4]|uniref:hypothetical protein n=1 Tax=Bordetella sp. LUAb4 TaxID=2843195 RepID=UPI001E41FE4B|nr:hypothetical protein [Bordetella sp. LUAb4]